MYDYPTVTIEQPLYVRLCITSIRTNVIFARVNAPNPTGTLVDVIEQATLRLLAEVDLPYNTIVFGAWDPEYGSRVEAVGLLELNGKFRGHRNPTIM